ncbi:MAG TPA: efflux RND transporter periplasmic adaptor subunit [Terriglobales bacterium]|nr:efflux RND transporter periplasmic adaptor subunit [Terriglobales bacterium]
MKRKHLLIIAGAVVLVTAAVSTFTVRAKNQTDAQPPSPVLPTVAVARVEPAPIIQSLVLSGEFKPFQQVDVHAKVAGYIRQIYVDVGDKVKKGQTLAILEVPELSAQLLAAHAAVRRAEDSIRRAQNEVARDKSSHQASHLDYNRLKQASLERPGLIAQQELDDAFAKDQSAEAQVDAAGASLSAAKNELGIAQADEKRLQAMADYTRIISPFDGVVTKRYADTGALVQAGTASSTQAMPVVTIAEYEKLRLVLPVPEDAVPAVHLGSLVDVNVLALHRHFVGKVARFADALDLQTRTMHTEVDVDNPKGTLVNGMYADVTLVLHEVKGALTVPIQAVTRNGNLATVLVVDPHDRIEPRQVQLGMEGPNRVEVISGLDSSDRVVIGNPSDFHPGEKVQPKPFQEAANNEEF